MRGTRTCWDKSVEDRIGERGGDGRIAHVNADSCVNRCQNGVKMHLARSGPRLCVTNAANSVETHSRSSAWKLKDSVWCKAGCSEDSEACEGVQD
jgi:hypothetical protein